VGTGQLGSRTIEEAEEEHCRQSLASVAGQIDSANSSSSKSHARSSGHELVLADTAALKHGLAQAMELGRNPGFRQQHPPTREKRVVTGRHTCESCYVPAQWDLLTRAFSAGAASGAASGLDSRSQAEARAGLSLEAHRFVLFDSLQPLPFDEVSSSSSAGGLAADMRSTRV
jgi:hypothetical protein